MNAVIRAVVRGGRHYGLSVYGIERGYQGLMDGQLREFNLRDVAGTIQRGGTILHSARSDDFRTPEGQARAIAVLQKHGIQGLVVVGGDGSFAGARALSQAGVPTVGIPGTIDNDLAYTQYCLGFDTALNTILEAINKLRDTMDSHERVLILEVMGRHCGDLALHAGLAGGAEAIIVPELPLSYQNIVELIKKAKKNGRKSCIVVMAEGAGKAEVLKEIIKELGGFSVRTTVLGHIQRGGSPSVYDRRLGTMFGMHAVQLLKEDKGNRVIGIRNNQLFDMDIAEGLAVKKAFDRELYDVAMIMAT
jgi:6-phosphofructokinase 1